MLKAIVKRKPQDTNMGTFNWEFPFRDVWDAMSRMERHFADFFGETAPIVTRESFIGPLIDLYKKDDNYVLEAAIPGLKKGDVEIHATEDSLTIKGEFKDDKKVEEKDVYWKEIKRGSFQRTVSFQEPIKPDDVKATYKDGILKITLPIEAPKKQKQIKIDVE